MTSWVRLTWDTVAQMLRDGTQDCTITQNAMTIECQGSQQGSKARKLPSKAAEKRPQIHKKGTDPTEMLAYARLGLKDAKVTKVGRGAKVEVKAATLKRLRRMSRQSSKRWLWNNNRDKVEKRASPSILLYSSTQYAELGASIARLSTCTGYR